MRMMTRMGASALAYRLTEKRLRILCYHGLWDVTGPHFGDKLFMSAERFEDRLRAIRQMGCNILPLGEGLERLRNGTLPPRAVCITIDDGWASTFSLMLPLLAKFGFPATIYMRTDRMQDQLPISPVAVRCALELSPSRAIDTSALRRLLSECTDSERLSPDLSVEASPRQMLPFAAALGNLFDSLPPERLRGALAQLFDILGLEWSRFDERRAFQLGTAPELRAAHRNGFDIQLHTHSHELGTFDAARVGAEIRDNRRALSSVLEQSEACFVHFCYPSGLFAPSAFPTLAELGVLSATTTQTGLAARNDNPLALPRLLDGQNTSAIRFQALLSGLTSALRSSVR